MVGENGDFYYNKTANILALIPLGNVKMQYFKKISLYNSSKFTEIDTKDIERH